MLRKIIQIDEEKCDGCGICIDACHEGAIGLIDGKAKLLRDDYCDGLGDCLPACPQDAISFVMREAVAYDEEAVKRNQSIKAVFSGGGCPGSQMKSLDPGGESELAKEDLKDDRPQLTPISLSSQLQQWPVQIKLVPSNAPYFEGASLLIAADCTAFAYGNFHNKFIKNRITLIGCPKLDSGDYSEKLTEIIRNNNIKNVTLVKMEVPCCSGLEQALIRALKDSGKVIPWQVITISVDGEIFE